jgi:predicted HTH domain antitoxin
MGEVISLRLPDETLKELEKIAKEEAKDKSGVIRELLALGLREKKLEKAIRLYREGRATLWKAARLAGISLWQMMEVMRERKDEAQNGLRELGEDMKALKE